MEVDGDDEDRLKKLYPFVDQSKTPLPSCWSSKDKFQFLGLTQNNLRVHYKGQGKTHKDAAAIRTDHPIPASCGIYYYEIRIVSKGRDGFMGVGLSQKDVSLNRLPGWDRFSYGYHGDDGNSFCSSGSGVPYGPTFTTDDVIGCGVNFIDNTCFFTKNGQNIGIAFTDVANGLYPTVGLQTPGEIIDANFGLQPFVYDIMEDMIEAQLRIQRSIERFPLPPTKTEWFNKLIGGYLIHHGFTATAEAFSSAGQATSEDVVSMKHRQNICKLVKSGRISEAIRQVQLLYPTLFEQKPDLLFLLECRQFIEMLVGNDTDIRRSSAKSSHSVSLACSPPQYKISSNLPSKTARPSPLHSPKGSPRASPRRLKSPRPRGSTTPSSEMDTMHEKALSRNGGGAAASEIHQSYPVQADVENGNKTSNGNCENGIHASTTKKNISVDQCAAMSFGEFLTAPSSALTRSGTGYGDDDSSKEMLGEYSMATDGMPVAHDGSAGQENIERLIEFGRELQQLYNQLKQKNVLTVKKQRILTDAFSLMAYSDPFNSPVSYQLEPSQREPVAAALNSAILEQQGYPAKPALEVMCSHANSLREEMWKHEMGASAFADPNFVLNN